MLLGVSGVRNSALIAAAIAAVACGDDSQGSFDAAGPDAGAVDATPGPDARVTDAGPQGVPDITVNLNRLIVDLAVEQKDFTKDACELHPEENCIDAAGTRTLLRFSIETPNIGTGDLFLGTPTEGNPLFVDSECHGHVHFLGYAEYVLLDNAGGTAAVGRKQAFCLLDTNKYLTDDPTVSDSGMYWCGYQGIQRGWSDVYTANLDCQFLDITDVPDGDYTLQVTLNKHRTIEELDYDNNTIEVPITIGSPDYLTPTEDCPAGVDNHSADGLHRECGWTFAGNFPCTPGQTVDIGCVDGGLCNLGSCTGDPMMRVCDPARPDGNCSFVGMLKDNDDGCGSECPYINNAICPDGGSIDVFHAPFTVGDPYTCNVQVN